MVALRHVESLRIRDWTHVSCTGRQMLYHWATREAPPIPSLSFPASLNMARYSVSLGLSVLISKMETINNIIILTISRIVEQNNESLDVKHRDQCMACSNSQKALGFMVVTVVVILFSMPSFQHPSHSCPTKGQVIHCEQDRNTTICTMVLKAAPHEVILERRPPK